MPNLQQGMKRQKLNMMTSQSRLKVRRQSENYSKGLFGLWGSLVQEVVINAKDDITFKFKNGFELSARDCWKV